MTQRIEVIGGTMNECSLCHATIPQSDPAHMCLRVIFEPEGYSSGSWGFIAHMQPYDGLSISTIGGGYASREDAYSYGVDCMKAWVTT